MIAIAVLVLAFAMVPLILWATRSKGRRGVRWNGIDWSRGMPPAAKLLAEGASLQRAAQDEAALSAFDQAIALDPSLVEAHVGRAFSRHRMKRWDDALADYDRAIALGGATSELLNNRGCLQRDRGDLDRAVADIEEAVRLAPDDATAHVSLAEVRAQRGEWNAALTSLNRAIAADPTWRDYARTNGAFASLRQARPSDDLFAQMP